MPNDPRVPFSDLEYARSTSRRLNGSASEEERKAGAGTPRFVRFRLRRRPAGHPDSERTFGAEGWHQLLDDCLDDHNARAAFVLGGEGLVIAARGSIDADSAQAIGARLMIGLKQAEQLNPEGTRSMLCAELGSDWVSALRFRYDDHEFLLALLGDSPLHSDARTRIEQQIAAELPSADLSSHRPSSETGG